MCLTLKGDLSFMNKQMNEWMDAWMTDGSMDEWINASMKMVSFASAY